MSKLVYTFPSITVLASYNFMYQVIEYNEMSRNEFNEAINKPYELKNLKNSKLIIHETSHFIDNMATLYGLKLFRSVISALNAYTSGDENNFYHIIELRKQILRNSLNLYYKEFTDVVTTTKPELWSMSNSIGARFDSDGYIDVEKPIIFCRFSYDQRHVARIPLSIESLFEINAVCSEIQTHMFAISKLNSVDSRTVEAEIMKRESINWIYSPELLTYSAAAHLVSIRLKISDIPKAFIVAKTLAGLSLNMPTDYYQRIKIPSSLNLPPERIEGLIKAKDPTIIYYLMVVNLQESNMFNLFRQDERVDIEAILQTNGLPNPKTFYEDTYAEFMSIEDKLFSGLYNHRWEYFYGIGKQLFERSQLNYDIVGPAYIQAATAGFNICGIDELCDENNPVIQNQNDVEFYISKFEKFFDACGY